MCEYVSVRVCVCEGESIYVCMYACVWVCTQKVYFGGRILIIQDCKDALICLLPFQSDL